MNIETMRRVDRLLGVPLCFVLTLTRCIFDRLSHRQGRAVSEPRKVLFVKLAEQGATVLAYPALHRAVERFGRENVFFLVFEENRHILDVMDVIPPGNVLALRTGGLARLVLSVFGCLRRLRALGIDTAIDLEFFARVSATLSYLSGARIRVGFHSFAGEAHYRGDLMTHRLNYNPRLHVETIYRMMIEAATLDPDSLPALDVPPGMEIKHPPLYKPGPNAVAECNAMLRREARREVVQPLILLNANASDLVPLRRWPSECYVELAKRLLEWSDGLCVAITGTREEVPAAQELVRAIHSDRCFSLAGKTRLEELLTLYSVATVLVTNDSGPAHFAALTPIRVVVMFGPESPAVFGPKAGTVRTIWKGLLCSPCVNAYNDRVSACRNNLCMQAITVDEVFNDVVESFITPPQYGCAPLDDCIAECCLKE